LVIAAGGTSPLVCLDFTLRGGGGSALLAYPTWRGGGPESTEPRSLVLRRKREMGSGQVPHPFVLLDRLRRNEKQTCCHLPTCRPQSLQTPRRSSSKGSTKQCTKPFPSPTAECCCACTPSRL